MAHVTRGKLYKMHDVSKVGLLLALCFWWRGRCTTRTTAEEGQRSQRSRLSIPSFIRCKMHRKKSTNLSFIWCLRSKHLCYPFQASPTKPSQNLSPPTIPLRSKVCFHFPMCPGNQGPNKDFAMIDTFHTLGFKAATWFSQRHRKSCVSANGANINKLQTDRSRARVAKNIDTTSFAQIWFKILCMYLRFLAWANVSCSMCCGEMKGTESLPGYTCWSYTY